jgi:hypothetical protein
MTSPQPGDLYRHIGEHGLGHRARIDDPTIDENEPAPKVKPSDAFALRRDLDMAPGTIIKVAGYDKHRNLVLVAWSDKLGTERITSIEPAVFHERFELLEG